MRVWVRVRVRVRGIMLAQRTAHNTQKHTTNVRRVLPPGGALAGRVPVEVEGDQLLGGHRCRRPRIHHPVHGERSRGGWGRDSRGRWCCVRGYGDHGRGQEVEYGARGAHGRFVWLALGNRGVLRRSPANGHGNGALTMGSGRLLLRVISAAIILCCSSEVPLAVRRCRAPRRRAGRCCPKP